MHCVDPEGIITGSSMRLKLTPAYNYEYPCKSCYAQGINSLSATPLEVVIPYVYRTFCEGF